MLRGVVFKGGEKELKVYISSMDIFVTFVNDRTVVKTFVLQCKN